jgi:hypothetical protein
MRVRYVLRRVEATKEESREVVTKAKVTERMLESTSVIATQSKNHHRARAGLEAVIGLHARECSQATRDYT